MQSKCNITVIGCHAEGEVGRVITGGILPPPGDSAEDKRLWFREHQDHLRRLLMCEPRGGAFVHLNLLVPPSGADAQAGFIVMEAADYPPMSGSNSMCVAQVLLETGMVPMEEPVTRLALEAPGGLVHVEAECEGGRCRRVTITNLPSFAFKLDAAVEVPGLGTITCDIAFGGDTFALVDAASLGFAIAPDEARQLVETGERIKACVNEQHGIQHPLLDAVDFVSFVQFTNPVERLGDGTLEGRNTVVISPGKLDRSPCGTGSSARLAVLHARGEIGDDDVLRTRSIIDTRFDCSISGTALVGDYPAVVPKISGRAFITGIHQYLLDPDDPFPEGYTLSDTWYRTI